MKQNDMSIPKNKTRVWLLCGPAASFAFLLADAIAGSLINHTDNDELYSFCENSISELLMPSTPLVPRRVGVTLMVTSNILGMIFAFLAVVPNTALMEEATGTLKLSLLRQSGDRESKMPTKQRHRNQLKRRSVFKIRYAGMSLGYAAICNLISCSVFPQDPRESESLTWSGILHLLLVALSVIFSLYSMVSIAVKLPSSFTSFRRFTVCTVLSMLIGVVATPMLVERHELGISERWSAYSFLFWRALLGIALLECEQEQEQDVVRQGPTPKEGAD